MFWITFICLLVIGNLQMHLAESNNQNIKKTKKLMFQDCNEIYQIVASHRPGSILKNPEYERAYLDCKKFISSIDDTNHCRLVIYQSTDFQGSREIISKSTMILKPFTVRSLQTVGNCCWKITTIERKMYIVKGGQRVENMSKIKKLPKTFRKVEKFETC